MKKLFLILSLFILGGCVETVVAGAVATGVLIAKEEKSKDTVKDVKIKQDIKKRIRKYEKQNNANKRFDDIGVNVIEKRVLLTGTIRDEKYKKDLYEEVWKSHKDIKEVINETKVARRSSKIKTKDALITSQIKAKFKAQKGIKSLNYDIVTVNKTVYLFGIAQDTEEMRLATNVASKTQGVKNVVSHIILKYDLRRES